MSLHPLTDPEEQVILDTPPHVLFLILPIFAVVVLWLLYLFIICPFIILFDGTCLFVSGLTFFLLILALFLDWINNRLVLANLKVIRLRGIIGKTIMEIRLDRIQDVKVSFGIFGRIFGFGTIEIESAGICGKILFRGIPLPRKINQLVDKEVTNSNLLRAGVGHALRSLRILLSAPFKLQLFFQNVFEKKIGQKLWQHLIKEGDFVNREN